MWRPFGFGYGIAYICSGEQAIDYEMYWSVVFACFIYEIYSL